MTTTDNLKLRLKDDPPYWKGNRPPIQMPPPELPAGPRRDPGGPMSRGERTHVEAPTVGTPDDLPPQD